MLRNVFHSKVKNKTTTTTTNKTKTNKQRKKTVGSSFKVRNQMQKPSKAVLCQYFKQGMCTFQKTHGTHGILYLDMFAQPALLL